MKTRPSTVALFLWVALVGPVARAAGTPNARPGLVLAISLGAAAAVFLTGEARWKARLVIALGAGAALVPTHGEQLALWLAASLLIAAWVAQLRPPVPFLPLPAPGVTAPVAVLCGVAGWLGHSATTTWQPMVPFALACFALVSPLGGDRLGRIGRRVGELAAAGVSAVTFVLVGSLVVVVPWAAQRLLLVDPLRFQTGWAPRTSRPARSAQPWVDEAATPAAPPPQRRRAQLAARGAVAAVTLLTVVALRSTAFTTGPEATTFVAPAESEGAPSWYPEYREDIAWAIDERVALRPFEVYRLLDVRTRHVNVEAGDRVSWVPPDCSCDRLSVWVYGGGAAFGLEQRDEHTVASELARVAAENGIAVDVRNRGIPGQLHWRTALRFGWDLTSEAPPDLVVFYEGSEEVDAAAQLTERGLGDVMAPYEPYVENLYDEIYGVDRPLPPPDGVERLGWPVAPSSVEPESVGELAAQRYDRSREISQDTADRYGVPIRYVWQPSLRADQGRSDDYLDSSAHLPTDVLDLTQLFSERPDVSFADNVHHDERGARMVAETLFAELEPELRALSGDGDQA